MPQYLLLYKSLTRAQQAARMLNAGGVCAVLRRAPRDIANISCGYALAVGCGLDAPLTLLNMRGLSPERTLTDFSGQGRSR